MTRQQGPDIADVIATIDLPDYIRSWGVTLKRDGREYVGCCPFHVEKTPSFTVFKKGNAWKFKCFGCGPYGDALDFFMQINGISSRSAGIEEFLKSQGHIDEKELQRRRDIAQRREREQKVRDDQDRADRVRAGRDIWKRGVCASGTLVADYLRARGIDPARLPDGIPPSIRYVPDLFHKPTGLVMPAMIAALQRPDRSFAAIHRTWLTQDGRAKAPVSKNKTVLGDPAGAAIRLSGPTETLVVSEGIETGLSCLVACPDYTHWTAYSLNNMANIIAPDGVKRIVYVRDGDTKRQTVDNILADTCARHRDRGIEPFITDTKIGMDGNDVLQGRA